MAAALFVGCAATSLPTSPAAELPLYSPIVVPPDIAEAAQGESGLAAQGEIPVAKETESVPKELAPNAAVPRIAPAEPGPVDVPLVTDPLQPGVRINPNDHEAQADLWDRVRAGFGFNDLEGKLVGSQERWYAARPDYVQRMTERGGRYLFHILQELERRGLPTELALLPFIESAFNPEAMSSARASGMWQFMPSTGKNYDLKQSVFRDDRRDVLASTRAALDYLEKLRRMFGDWHLALAAYNWGEGNVARAISRNRLAGKPTDYASLRMPNETQHYVPKLQAVKNIVARPGAFGLSLPALANHPYFLGVRIERDIDVDLAAQLAGLGIDDFRALNPQMNKPVILAAGTSQVLLPYDNANRFVQDLPRYKGRLASWTAWVAPKTLKPADAARQVGMDEAQLRLVNRIPERMLIQAGSVLLVPRSDQPQADVSGQLADHATMALSPDGPHTRRVSVRAGRRDSVMSVAKRFGVSAEHVAHWNRVDSTAAFRPGQSVIVFVPPKAKRSSSTAASRTVHHSKPANAARKAATNSRERTARR